MKNRKIAASLIALLIFGTATAQKLPAKDVPSVILNAFQTRFRNAEDVEWKHKHGYYEVEFEIGRREHEIKYDAKGNILSYEEELDLTNVPQPVQAAIKSQYPGSTVKEAKKIESGNVTYKVEIRNTTGEEWDIILDASGKILSKKLD